MAFYEELSTYYDYIFPVNETQLNFFRDCFKRYKVNKVLDLACGSGNYTTEFAKWGLKAVGIDLEEEMIEKARAKASKREYLSFKVEDMRELSFDGESFEGAICIGNSLPHITNDQDLRLTLKEMYRILKRDGILILQTVNYDRILKDEVKELPLIKNEEIGLKFVRKYHFRDDKLIDFNTELEIGRGEISKTYRNTVILKPLTKGLLENLLKETGFKKITFFGAFDGREFNENSPATILIAEK